jgi:hypothetical protein
MRSLTFLAAQWLLAHRFVAPIHEAVWHIAKGPRAGDNYSGEIADSSFVSQLEQPFVLKPEVRRKYNLKYYARVRDDLFFILGRSPFRRDFWKDWNQFARRIKSGYIIDEFEASMVSVTVVDLDIRKEPGEKKLKWSIHWKPSSLGVPLSHLSNHFPMIHASWPRAEHRRIADRCSTHCDYLQAKAVFVQRLLFYHFDSKVVSEIIESDVYGRARARRTKAQHELQQRQWLVLPSHPLWHSMKINRIMKWGPR